MLSHHPASLPPVSMQVRASTPAWALKLDLLLSFWLLQPLWAALAWLLGLVRGPNCAQLPDRSCSMMACGAHTLWTFCSSQTCP